MKTRAAALQNIESNSFDLCVIGGGATGSGCALDAQLRGLKTVLLEARDFASATSSASTKMVHGGVRYLEQAVRGFDLAQWGVVRRALAERILMLRNAPFLTGTMEFLTPCFHRWDAAYLGIGLKLYDWIAGKAGLAPSRFVPQAEALRRMPNLNPKGLLGAMAYTDGQFDDARYNMALVETFADAGGEALNYARVTAFEKGPDRKLRAAEVEDAFSHRRFMVRARAFVNAAGPWADSVREMATPSTPRRLRLSKGVHIVLPLDVWSSRDAMLIPKTEDGRVLFAIPCQGRLLVGTTDKEVSSPDELALTTDEAEYLLHHLSRYLARPVARTQIVSGSAGARALVSARGTKRTSKLVRDHEVELDRASGLISILGGKWTTYRAMAEDTVNAVQKYLGGPVSACATRDYLLAGSRGYTPDYSHKLAHEFGLSAEIAQHLAGKFGARATDVAALAKHDPDLARPLVEELPPLRAEVIYAIRHEMAVGIEDILARRIGLEFYSWKDAVTAAPVVADLLARHCHWPESTRHEALAHYLRRVHDLMERVGLASP